MDKDMEKIKEGKLGAWLREKKPDVLEIVGDALPEKGVLGIVKNLVGGDPEADRLIDEAANKAISDRWKADMGSDSWLSKNVRPMALISLLTLYLGLAVADSMDNWAFDVKESYIALLEVLMMTAFGAYFAGRSFEKFKR